MDVITHKDLQLTTIKCEENSLDIEIQQYQSGDLETSNRFGKDCRVASFSNTSSEKPYKCYNCKVIYCFDDELRTHMLIHTVENPFQCNICCECFSNIFSLKKHILGGHLCDKSENHQNPSKSDEDLNLGIPVDENAGYVGDFLHQENSEPSFVEHDTDKKIKIEREESNSQNHYSCKTDGLYENSEDIPNISSETLDSKGNISDGTFLGSEKGYQFSNSSFDNSSHVKSMNRKHSAEKFKCEICGLTYEKKTSLANHMKIHVDGDSTTNGDVDDEDYGKESQRRVKKKENRTCDICNKKFKIPSQLKRHNISVHMDKRPFQCEVCNKSFKRKSHLQEHSVIHTGVKPFTCDICEKNFQFQSGLNAHRKKHKLNVRSTKVVVTEKVEAIKKAHCKKSKELNITCAVCHKQFTKRKEYENHRRSHVKSFKAFTCTVCNESFHTMSDLTEHGTTHPEDTNNHPLSCMGVKESELDLDLDAKPSKDSDVMYFGCNKCNESFADIESLKVHAIIHENKVKSSSDSNHISHDESNLEKQEPAKNNLKPIKCNVCDQTFADFRNLQSHITIHTGEKPYNCEVCGKAFRRYGDRLTHTKRHNVFQTPYNCTLCKKKFLSQQRLDNHMKTHKTKTIKKNFVCSICHWAFINNKGLQDHMRRHTGEKPFKCDVCDMSFRQQGTLRNHKKTHAEVKPYICKECGHGCSTKKGMELHMMKHTGEKPYQCEYCGIGYITVQKLTDHVRMHTGERPFECSTCGKAFTKRETLKEHETIHKDDRPFLCSLCGNGFKRKSTLRQHMWTHRKD